MNKAVVMSLHFLIPGKYKLAPASERRKLELPRVLSVPHGDVLARESRVQDLSTWVPPPWWACPRGWSGEGPACFQPCLLDSARRALPGFPKRRGCWEDSSNLRLRGEGTSPIGSSKTARAATGAGSRASSGEGLSGKPGRLFPDKEASFTIFNLPLF